MYPNHRLQPFLFSSECTLSINFLSSLFRFPANLIYKFEHNCRFACVRAYLCVCVTIIMKMQNSIYMLVQSIYFNNVSIQSARKYNSRPTHNKNYNNKCCAKKNGRKASLILASNSTNPPSTQSKIHSIPDTHTHSHTVREREREKER